MLKFNRKIWIALTILEMIVIVYLSIRPESEGAQASIPRQAFHKFGHIMAYGVLMYFLLQSFLYFDKMYFSMKNKLILRAFNIAICFGVFNEFLQIFVPSRFARLHDILVNAVGAGIVILVLKIMKL